jgi:hypothetical protein
VFPFLEYLSKKKRRGRAGIQGSRAHAGSNAIPDSSRIFAKIENARAASGLLEKIK